MPVLSEKGDVAAGRQGGGVVSINFEPVLTGANERAWLNKDEDVSQQCDADGKNCKLIAVKADKSTREIANQGATEIFAGGGVWAANLASNPPQIFGTANFVPGKWIYAIGPDGSVAQKADAERGGLLLNGELCTLADVNDVSVYLAVDDAPPVAVWRDGAKAFWGNGKFKNEIPVYSQSFGWLRICLVDGEPWIGYQNYDAGGRYQVHPVGDPFGYIAYPGPNTFAPAMMRLPPEVQPIPYLRVVLSTNEAETPNALIMQDLLLSGTRVDLRLPVSAPAPIPPPAPVPPPSPIPAPVPTPGPLPMPNPNETRESAEKRLAVLIVFGRGNLGQSALIEGRQSARELFDGLDYKTTDEYDALMAHCIRKNLP